MKKVEQTTAYNAVDTKRRAGSVRHMKKVECRLLAKWVRISWVDHP